MSGVTTGVTIVTLVESAVGGSLGTLVKGAGKSCWTATGSAGRGAMVAGAIGVMAVMLDKMRESDRMAEN